MVITWNTRKTSNGYEFIISRVGYKHYEVIKTGVCSSRAKAMLLGKKWIKYLKSQEINA